MSDQLKTLEILKSVMLEISAKYPIKSLAIFGSVSRKEDNQDSDIDILFEFNRSVGMEFIYLCYELERLLIERLIL